MGKRASKEEKAYRAIGLKIRQLREAKGWTLERAEGEGGITWQQLQKIESGRNITIRTLIRLADMLRVHPSELLSDL
jgi:transcriptional regulator with XRE-family HTH domain